MYFDSHAHYDDEKFDDDRTPLLTYMPENGVDFIVDPGQDVKTSEKARDIAERFPFIYFAAGYHPHEAGEMTDADFQKIRSLLEHPKAVAVGEIGLDYHYDFWPRDVQQDVFIKHLELARELKKPVIVHNRESTEDCMNILRRFRGIRGVVHCYSGSWETAKELLNLGWYISFTGAITFKNAKKALETVENMPIKRLMIETDAPYMTPEPFRGKRNNSLLLSYVVRKIAEVRRMTEQEVAEITSQNAKRFFGIE